MSFTGFYRNSRFCSQDSFGRRLARLALCNTAIGVCIQALCAIFDYRSMMAHFWTNVLIYQLFTQCIGTTAGIVLPVAATLLAPLRAAIRWPVYVGVLVAVGTIAPVFATWAVLALHLLGRARFWEVYPDVGRTSVLVTVMVGIATYAMEKMREQVQTTTLQLRTQQLERERALKLAAEAQLGSLQSRLQPHFLFNTINSILALLREDPARAEEMLERLARLLRFALDSQQAPAVALRDELRLVRDYLEIERMRFGARLEYEIDAAAELELVEVPAYSLQTLVENSMKHAIAPRRQGGRIRVRVAREGDGIVAEVFDDGPGFTREALAAGHGLDMLERRLAALHGARASLEIVKYPGGGGVRFRLPAMVPA
jgi:signal transduction histidine kinase